MRSSFGVAAALAMSFFSTGARAQTVAVHVDNPRVTIERKDGDDWVEVCSAPCDRALATYASYRVAGDNVKRQPFKLEGFDRTRVALHVETGSRTLQILGISLASSAGGAIFTGLVFLLIGALEFPCGDCVSGFADTTLLNFGWAFVIGGTVAEMAGVALIATTQTTVTLEPQTQVHATQFPLVRFSF